MVRDHFKYSFMAAIMDATNWAVCVLDMRSAHTYAQCIPGQVHLFDIDIPGKITFKESETLTPGQTGTVVDTDAGRIGVAICYDLRFPELAMVYARHGVQLIIYPGVHHAAGALPLFLQSTPVTAVLDMSMQRVKEACWKMPQRRTRALESHT